MSGLTRKNASWSCDTELHAALAKQKLMDSWAYYL